MSSLIITQRSGRVHEVLFDEEDAAVIAGHRWHVQQDTRNKTMFYASTAIKRQEGGYHKVRMHMLLTGQIDMDHIDHNGLNNRRSNLRKATRSEQGGNRLKNRNGSSQYKGVSWHKRSHSWVAGIRVNGRRIELGRYDSQESAARRYDQAAREAWGTYALTNFPEALGGQG